MSLFLFYWSETSPSAATRLRPAQNLADAGASWAASLGLAACLRLCHWRFFWNRARDKVRLGPGVTLTLQYIVLETMQEDNLLRAAHLEFLTPSAPGSGAWVQLINSVSVAGMCFPPGYQQQNAASVARPPELPGAQVYSINKPQAVAGGCVEDPDTTPPPVGTAVALIFNSSGSGSSSSSNTSSGNTSSSSSSSSIARGSTTSPALAAVPLLRRCWRDAGGLYDVGLIGSDVDAAGRTFPVNYNWRFLNCSYVCRGVLYLGCVQKLGPVGCLLVSVRESASWPALVQNFSAALPGPPGGDGGGGGGVQGGALAGVVVGGVAGALALVAMATALVVLARRRRLARQQQSAAAHSDLETGGGKRGGEGGKAAASKAGGAGAAPDGRNDAGAGGGACPDHGSLPASPQASHLTCTTATSSSAASGRGSGGNGGCGGGGGGGGGGGSLGAAGAHDSACAAAANGGPGLGLASPSATFIPSATASSYMTLGAAADEQQPYHYCPYPYPHPHQHQQQQQTQSRTGSATTQSTAGGGGAGGGGGGASSLCAEEVVVTASTPLRPFINFNAHLLGPRRPAAAVRRGSRAPPAAAHGAPGLGSREAAAVAALAAAPAPAAGAGALSGLVAVAGVSGSGSTGALLPPLSPAAVNWAAAAAAAAAGGGGHAAGATVWVDAGSPGLLAEDAPGGGAGAGAVVATGSRASAVSPGARAVPLSALFAQCVQEGVLLGEGGRPMQHQHQHQQQQLQLQASAVAGPQGLASGPHQRAAGTCVRPPGAAGDADNPHAAVGCSSSSAVGGAQQRPSDCHVSSSGGAGPQHPQQQGAALAPGSGSNNNSSNCSSGSTSTAAPADSRCVQGSSGGTPAAASSAATDSSAAAAAAAAAVCAGAGAGAAAGVAAAAAAGAGAGAGAGAAATTARHADTIDTSRQDEGHAMSGDDGGGGGGGGGDGEEGVEDEDKDGLVTLVPGGRVLGKGAYGRVVLGRYRGHDVAVKLLLHCTSTAVAATAAGSGTAGQGEGKAGTTTEGGGGIGFGGGEEEEEGAALATFKQEVAVLGRCAHPNVLTLLAACAAPPCLVFELMDTSLDRWLAAERAAGRLLPLPQVLHIGIQVARGLAYLHPTILHRDLKPSNVLVSNIGSPQPVVKLADFGLARLNSTVLFTENVNVGTAAYMSPETLNTFNCCVTHHTDMFSYGMLMFELLAGRRPWEGRDMLQVAVAVAQLGQRPPLEALVPHRCPPALAELIKQCWDRVPERRPAASEALKELLLLQQELQQQQPPQLLQPPRQQ